MQQLQFVKRKQSPPALKGRMFFLSQNFAKNWPPDLAKQRKKGTNQQNWSILQWILKLFCPFNGRLNHLCFLQPLPQVAGLGFDPHSVFWLKVSRSFSVSLAMVLIGWLCWFFLIPDHWLHNRFHHLYYAGFGNRCLWHLHLHYLLGCLSKFQFL